MPSFSPKVIDCYSCASVEPLCLNNCNTHLITVDWMWRTIFFKLHWLFLNPGFSPAASVTWIDFSMYLYLFTMHKNGPSYFIIIKPLKICPDICIIFVSYDCYWCYDFLRDPRISQSLKHPFIIHSIVNNGATLTNQLFTHNNPFTVIH